MIPLVVSPKTLVALTAIVALTFVHIRGLRLGRVVQNGLASIKVSALVVFVALGFTIGNGVPSQIVTPGTIGRGADPAGAHPDHVHVLGLECRGVRG